MSLAVLVLSFRLKSIPRQKGVKIDFVGALLIALAMILISLGFNNLNSWGVVMAKDAAPISLFGLSPAPFMVLIGIVFAQGFFTWSHYREKKAKTPLLSLQVLDSSQERSATFSLLIIGALGPAVNFLIPLYIQIVQGRTTLQTSIAVIPYTLAIFTAAVLIVRLYGRLAPRTIGTIAFITVSIGLTILAFTISNDWGTPIVILGLVILGLGEGALVTLLFNVLVTASPKELAGDVGALRGTTNNLSTALGTAFASVVAVGLLSLFVLSSVGDNPLIPLQLKAQVNLDTINFVSNAQLQQVMAATTATVRTGHRGGAHQRDRTAAGAQGIVPHPGRHCTAGRFPRTRPAQLCAGRSAGRRDHRKQNGQAYGQEESSRARIDLQIQVKTSLVEGWHRNDVFERYKQ